MPVAIRENENLPFAADLIPFPVERELSMGIDPGLSGGLAILDRGGGVVDVSPMPDSTKDIWEYFMEFGARIRMAHIEFQQAMPFHLHGRRLGASSTFNFGRHYGELLMALMAACIPHERVQPRIWQKNLHCLSKGDKKVTKARATELFPGQRLTLKTADAILLAEHCRRMHP